MGWGRTLLLGDIGTQLNVNDVEADVEQVKQHLEMQDDKNASQDEAVARLQQENHELKMYIATLLRLPVSKNVLTKEELNKFVDLLDPK
jgi:DNA-binding GntR family transcriptional regulator